MERDWHRAPFARRLTQAVLWRALKLVWGFRVEGLERIPAEGPFIFAGNHNALIDGPILGVVTGLASRFAQPLAKAELYAIPFVGWYLRQIGTIPLDRRGDVQAMRFAFEWMTSGGALIIFPEGTRSKDGKPLRPKAGVGFMSARSGAAVVPARIEGTNRFPFARIRVVVGAPLPPPSPDSDRAACLAYAEKVMAAVVAL